MEMKFLLISKLRPQNQKFRNKNLKPQYYFMAFLDFKTDFRYEFVLVDKVKKTIFASNPDIIFLLSREL